jgi:thioredoxin
MTIEVTEENFERTVTQGTVLLDWWAAWCGPCRAFAPVFEKAATKYPDITFGKIDTEAQQGLAAAFEISSIPTLMVFRDGILLFAQAGALPGAALDQLIEQVQALDMDDVRKKIAEAKAAEARGEAVDADEDTPIADADDSGETGEGAAG